jgi:hypothetical protein
MQQEKGETKGIFCKYFTFDVVQAWQKGMLPMK